LIPSCRSAHAQQHSMSMVAAPNACSWPIRSSPLGLGLEENYQAAGKGFEPSVALWATLVFKTSAFNLSATHAGRHRIIPAV
jgi:hypothetical protein